VERLTVRPPTEIHLLYFNQLAVERVDAERSLSSILRSILLTIEHSIRYTEKLMRRDSQETGGVARLVRSKGATEGNLKPHSRKEGSAPKPQLIYDEANMSIASPVYLEIIDFIAGGTTPEAVIDFHPSPEAQQRLAALIEREKADGVSPEERAELEHFMELEHILRMAKARARQILSRGE
jgi:hypothetical protein